MALLKCPECSREVSSRATSCPHCGFPVSGRRARSPEFRTWCNRNRTVGIGAGVVGIIFGVAIAVVAHPVGLLMSLAALIGMLVNHYVWTNRRDR